MARDPLEERDEFIVQKAFNLRTAHSASTAPIRIVRDPCLDGRSRASKVVPAHPGTPTYCFRGT